MGKRRNQSADYVGSVGNETMCILLGANVVKRKITNMTNPNTAGQVSQRLKFSAMTQLAKKMSVALSAGLSKAAVGMYPRNLFTRLNKSAFSESGGTVTTDWPALQIAKGPVAPLQFSGTPTIDSDGDVTLTTINNTDGVDGLATDTASVCAVLATTGQTFFKHTTQARSTFTTGDVLDLENTLPSGVYKVYAFMRRADNSAVSDSVYVGSLTVA